jgi:hypothetical protein
VLHDRPFLIIIGKRNDPGRYYQKHWESFFPHASKTVIRRGYHFPMRDEPDLFASSVDRWWREKFAATI